MPASVLVSARTLQAALRCTLSDAVSEALAVGKDFNIALIRKAVNGRWTADDRVKTYARGSRLGVGHSANTLGMGFLVLSVALAVAPTFAQSPASPAAQASPAPAAVSQVGAPTGGVEEIVVTAQKREQLSEQVPIALTALTA